MATDPETLDDGQDEREDAPDPEQDAPDDGDEGALEEAGAGEDEDVITLGGEAARAEDEGVGVRNMRARIKELESENRSLRGQPANDTLPDKPTLESCDYDDEAYETALIGWHEKKRQHEDGARKQAEQAEKAQRRWQEQSRQFEDGWAGLNIRGKDAARAKVEDNFDEMQRALLVKASRGNAAGLYFVLGSNPERLAALVALKDDPAEFVAEAAVLAKETVVTRKPRTLPEQRHVGGSGGGRSDAKLERLERKAAETGDRTELIRYRKATRK